MFLQLFKIVACFYLPLLKITTVQKSLKLSLSKKNVLNHFTLAIYLGLNYQERHFNIKPKLIF